ncbi:MAG: hypothetical protein GC159_05395 [Phycisphaera sp.]|nr:hypothetical protein [Phycisphaera sp.]
MESQRTGRILRRIESMGYAVETDSAEGVVCMAAVDDEGVHHVVTAADVNTAARELAEHLGLDELPAERTPA